jgi:hypothetical protein
MFSACNGPLDCIPFLLVCWYLGFSLLFLDRAYRIYCGLGLALWLGMLALGGLTAPLYASLLAVLNGFVLTYWLSPVRGFVLPIRLTFYTPINVLLFFIPFLPAMLTCGTTSTNNALAMLMATCVLLPVPWTFYVLVQSLLEHQLGLDAATRHPGQPVYNGPFLVVSWLVCGACLAAATLVVFAHWIFT